MSDFINVSIGNEFDGALSMDIINEQLDIFSNMNEEFS